MFHFRDIKWPYDIWYVGSLMWILLILSEVLNYILKMRLGARWWIWQWVGQMNHKSTLIFDSFLGGMHDAFFLFNINQLLKDWYLFAPRQDYHSYLQTLWCSWLWLDDTVWYRQTGAKHWWVQQTLRSLRILDGHSQKFRALGPIPKHKMLDLLPSSIRLPPHFRDKYRVSGLLRGHSLIVESTISR